MKNLNNKQRFFLTKTFKLFWLFGLCLLSVPILSVSTLSTNVLGVERIKIQLQPAIPKTVVSAPTMLAQNNHIEEKVVTVAAVTQPQPTTTQKTRGVKRKIAVVSKINPESIKPSAETENQTVDCTFTMSQKPVYSGRFLSVTKKSVAAPGEVFQIVVTMENTGNVPWFSVDSGCSENPVYLGTTKDKDRASLFTTNIENDSGWLGSNRIKMETKRVSPLGTAIFSFWVKAPQVKGLYREYFATVAEGKTWIEGEAQFSFDTYVGNIVLSERQQQYLPYMEKSGNLTAISLDGDKKMEVDLSEQRLQLKIGDTVLRTFPISSGTRKTPTPRGPHQILLKQEVRVAGKAPHYIMPKFMMFRSGGFGFHALPSLANDHGVFWREALNHIGTPRSHGCIRLLPDDAEFAFSFADIGTKVDIYS